MNTQSYHLQEGELVEIGDRVISNIFASQYEYQVHKVTKKYSYVKFPDGKEGKFPRIFSRNHSKNIDMNIFMYYNVYRTK